MSVCTPSALKRVALVSGLLYVLLSVVCSFYYLWSLTPFVANDFWWADFNSTGAQTFVGDTYHTILELNSSSNLNLLRVISDRQYGGTKASIRVHTAYGRRLLQEEVPLTRAIESIRGNSIVTHMRIPTQYCWADFERYFEMAHTIKRQERCREKFSQNGAVYLATMLRNVDLSGLASDMYMDQMNITIFQPIIQMPHGSEWTHSIFHHAWPSVAEEERVWRQHGISIWKTQLQNLFDVQLMQSISIITPLGLPMSMIINGGKRGNRDSNQWTTSYAYCGVWNDLWWGKWIGFSLILNSNHSALALGIDWDLDLNVGSENTTILSLVRSTIGPYDSIDLFIVQPPRELSVFVYHFEHFVKAFIYEQPSERDLYLGQESYHIHPVPRTWLNHVYYGGNPFCVYRTAQDTPQEVFGYYDACNEQLTLSIWMEKSSVLFAVYASSMSAQKFRDTCSLAPEASAICNNFVHVANQLFMQLFTALPDKLQLLRLQALDSVAPLNISLIQFAEQQDGTLVTLSQSILDHEWSLFGWITIYEWQIGHREVYSFSGDIDSVVLLTRRHEYIPFEANALEIPSRACRYILGVAFYVSLLLGIVALLLLGYVACSKKDELQGRNLFMWNRVAGFVWIGRPFLFVRGMTALILFCTAPMSFVRENGLSRFRSDRRSLLDTAVIAGEATWLTYLLNDIMLPLTNEVSSTYSVYSSILTWVMLIGLEQISPFEAVANINQLCSITQHSLAVECDSGEVRIGSPQRFTLMLCLVVACVLLSYIIARLVKSKCRKKHDEYVANFTRFSFSSPSISYLLIESSSDPIICIMSGIFPWRSLYFDVKLWIVTQLPTQTNIIHCLPHSIPVTSKKQSPLIMLSGLVYVVTTVAISYNYLGLTRSIMANDMWWTSFNSTGAQSFLIQWWNYQLLFTEATDSLTLDDVSFSDIGQSYNATSSPKFDTPPLYANQLQDQINTLPNVISGLRRMDSCDLPWIFTSYCFIDFKQRWEMAPSAIRQAKCRLTKSNGAVYLESILRNSDWSGLQQCWGHALDLAVFDDLQLTVEGQSWLKQTQQNAMTVESEVLYWSSHGITSYTTQWQNYKLLGVLESFSVQNAIGVTYPFTLKRSNASFQLDQQTSFKMYWGFANDLKAIASNGSLLSGKSLLRESVRYAFANITMENVLTQNGTIGSPLNKGLNVIQAEVGPFGTISMHRVPCPREVIVWLHATTGWFKTLLGEDLDALVAYSKVVGPHSMQAEPKIWSEILMIGGNPMCPADSTPADVMLSRFSNQGPCLVNFADVIYQGTLVAVFALIASGCNNQDFDWRSIDTIASPSVPDSSTLASMLESIKTIILPYDKTPEFKRVTKLGYDAVQVIRSHKPSIDNIQFLHQVNSSFGSSISSFQLLDPKWTDFDYFAWIYLIDWAHGRREVITFEGEIGSITTFSASQFPDSLTANPYEIPLNVASYIRYAIIYITSILFIVAAMTSCYIFTSHGHVEGLNMFVFNRVAGQVWIGRPLLLLRAVSAIWLLSTASLELVQFGDSVRFVSHETNLWKIWMASGEVTWLVYIVNDIFSVITQQYLYKYSMKSSLLVWCVAASWNYIVPVRHKVIIDRKCVLESVDYQAVCHAGVVEIGSLNRVLGLVCLALGSCVSCYIVERIRRPTLDPRCQSASLLLHGSAKFGFASDRWTVNGVYYLDKASAVLTGVLAIHHGTRLYLFDVKMWRLHVLDTSELQPLPPQLNFAIPLVD